MFAVAALDKTLVWFDDVDISAFHSCVIYLWLSLSEWHLLCLRMFWCAAARICLSSLVYGIVSLKCRVTCTTNEVLTSRHDCVFEMNTCNLDLPKKLDNCKIYTRYCSMHRNKTWSFYILYFTKKAYRLFKEDQCYCKLCVKNGTASLKLLC